VAICYGRVVHWYTLSHLSLSESRGLLVQTPNVSRGLHVQTPRLWVLTAQCYVSGAVSNLLLLSAILLSGFHQVALVTTLIPNEYRQSSKSSVLMFEFKVLRRLRMPIARYCLSVELV
jgi:hypothetical protein